MALHHLGKEIKNIPPLCSDRSLISMSRPIATVHLSYCHVSALIMSLRPTPLWCTSVHYSSHETSCHGPHKIARLSFLGNRTFRPYIQDYENMCQCRLSFSQPYFRASRAESHRWVPPHPQVSFEPNCPQRHFCFSTLRLLSWLFYHWSLPTSSFRIPRNLPSLRQLERFCKIWKTEETYPRPDSRANWMTYASWLVIILRRSLGHLIHHLEASVLEWSMMDWISIKLFSTW